MSSVWSGNPVRFGGAAWMAAAASGKIPGWGGTFKFGEREGVAASDGWVDVISGTFNRAAANTAIWAWSTSAKDDAGGVGALTVQCLGNTLDGEEGGSASAGVALTATTAVDMGVSLADVTRGKVITAGTATSNIGTIHFGTSDKVTTYATIPPGGATDAATTVTTDVFGQTQICAFRVPDRADIAWIFYISAEIRSAQNVTSRIICEPRGGARRVIRSHRTSSENQSSDEAPPIPQAVSPGDFLTLQSKLDVGTNLTITGTIGCLWRFA